MTHLITLRDEIMTQCLHDVIPEPEGNHQEKTGSLLRLCGAIHCGKMHWARAVFLLPVNAPLLLAH